jgi:hypothetical protein
MLASRGLSKRRDRIRGSLGLTPYKNKIGSIEQELRAAVDHRFRVLWTIHRTRDCDSPLLA